VDFSTHDSPGVVTAGNTAQPTGQCRPGPVSARGCSDPRNRLSCRNSEL
jgi:hypothetical protein